VAGGVDYQNSVLGHAASRELDNPLAHRAFQRRRAGDVKSELHGGGDLVDVLSAGTRGANEIEL
jgi:hypothetical protein